MRLRLLRLSGTQLAGEERAPRPQPLLQSLVLRGEGGVAVSLALGRRQLPGRGTRGRGLRVEG